MVKKVKIKSENHLILLIIIILFFLYILWISKIFIIPIITAMILSFVSYPLFHKIKSWTNKPRLSALLTLITLTFLVLVPLIALLISVANESISFFSSFKISEIFVPLESLREFLNSTFNFSLSQTDWEGVIINGFTTIRQRLVGYSFKILNGITMAIFQIFFILIFMFYFYLHGKKVKRYIFYLLPFSDENKAKLEKELGDDTNALIIGQGLIAIVQGIVTGLGLFIFGVPNFILWGFVTMLASFIPIIGAWLVWIPASIYLFAYGYVYPAIGMALWGLIFSTNIENFLRPLFVQSIAKINFLVVLIGVVIGVRNFGVIGFILGPLILSTLLILINIYLDEKTSHAGKNLTTKRTVK